jgi:hypothetical protein
VRFARLKGAPQSLAQPSGVDRFGGLDDEDVDQILRPRATPLVLAIRARVGVDLLGEMLVNRHGTDANRLDPGEREKPGGVNRLRLREGVTDKRDIHSELLEDPRRELGVDMEADGGEVVGIVELIAAHDGEREIVVHRELLRSRQILGGGFLVVSALDVDVLRRSC